MLKVLKNYIKIRIAFIEILVWQSILKMLSFVYNVFATDIFQDMRIYSWQKAGYCIEKTFQVFNIGSETFTANCNDYRFVKCIDCSFFICIGHTFHQAHL